MRNRLLALLIAFACVACVNGNEVTPEQLLVMGRADEAVAEALFDAEVDAATSYNVRKDGSVVIRFAPAFEPAVYQKVVADLRADRRVPRVDAEQGGKSVCILSR